MFWGATGRRRASNNFWLGTGSPSLRLDLTITATASEATGLDWLVTTEKVEGLGLSSVNVGHGDGPNESSKTIDIVITNEDRGRPLQ
jgi:hypothetical protein